MPCSAGSTRKTPSFDERRAMRYWKHRDERELVTRIRGDAPTSSRGLDDRIPRGTDGRRRGRSFEARVASVTAITLVLAGAFAAVGGARYAAEAVKQARTAVAHAVPLKETRQLAAAAPSQRVGRSASSDQYRPNRVTICHRSASG